MSGDTADIGRRQPVEGVEGVVGRPARRQHLPDER